MNKDDKKIIDLKEEFDENILPKESVNILAVKERETLYEELEKKDKKLEETRRENEELRRKLTNNEIVSEGTEEDIVSIEEGGDI